MGFEAPSLTECPFDKEEGSKKPSQPFGAIPSLYQSDKILHFLKGGFAEPGVIFRVQHPLKSGLNRAEG